MKKYTFVLLAGLLALGLSAFTPKKTQTTYFIHPNGVWLEISEEDACPEGEQTNCVVDNPYTQANDPTQVYKSMSTSDLLKRPGS